MISNYTIQKIQEITGARLLGNFDGIIRHLSIDTRRIQFAGDTLFFAIPTARRDGFNFIPDAWQRGVRSFVVQHAPNETWQEKAAFLLVDNVADALQALAAWHRQQFRIPVTGITGSNGKTIVKEWICQLWEEDHNIARSPKSFNSQIGVPLSVWTLNEYTEAGIFEAGISQPGEMEKLEKIIRPGIGLFVMLGDAHDSGFESREAKLHEKLKLFNHCEAICCNSDDDLVWEALQNLKIPLISWGMREGSSLQILDREASTNKTRITALYHRNQIEFPLPVIDEVDIFNLLHVINFLLFRGLPLEVIKTRVLKLSKLPLRLQWEEGIRNCRILNDAYSNDFTSLSMALQALQRDGRHNRKTVILSDLSVPSNQAREYYGRLADLLCQTGVQRLLGIGPEMSRIFSDQPVKNLEVHTFSHTAALLQQLDQVDIENEDILIKGGRRFGFEEIARALQAFRHETVLEIDLSAMQRNLLHYKSLLQPGVKMMVMVKAFGYGIGAREVSKLVAFAGVDYLAVAYVDEGVALRQNGITLPVMVLNTEADSFAALEKYNLEPVIYSFEILEAFFQWCRSSGQNRFPVHLDMDTGMHRLGFIEHEWIQLADALQAQDYLQVKSIFTHFASSEEPEHDHFTLQQMNRFLKAAGIMDNALPYAFLKHAANTNAIARHPQVHFDMVRLGIGLYGGVDGLEPVLRLFTRVAQVKHLKAGQTVGYGQHTVLQKDSVIATVRIGYADGYRRKLGNGNGFMLVNGKPVPAIGNICMDMTMLDVTEIGEVNPGDHVEIFGLNQSIQQVATQAETIPYEIMTGISGRVKRIYNEE